MNNVKAIFRDYHSIIEIIGYKRIQERLETIESVYENFAMNYGEKEIRLNERVLGHAILDYFTDITRLKDFHGIDKINTDKIIAYEASWFIRRKPIQIVSNENENLVYVNEKFVLSILIHHLTNGEIDSLDGNDMLQSFCDTMLYYLKYRDCNAKFLEIMILSFKAGNSIQKINYK